MGRGNNQASASGGATLLFGPRSAGTGPKPVAQVVQTRQPGPLTMAEEEILDFLSRQHRAATPERNEVFLADIVSETQCDMAAATACLAGLQAAGYADSDGESWWIEPSGERMLPEPW